MQTAFRRYTTRSGAAALKEWINTVPSLSHSELDHVSLNRVRGLVSTTEVDGLASAWQKGHLLPQGWTLLLFPPSSSPLSSLGLDGTERGPFHPPPSSGPLERMWVSGSWSFPRPTEIPGLRIGEEVECRSRVAGVVEKMGRDGRAGWYVDQVREIRRVGEEGGEPVVLEKRMHLYRRPLAQSDPAEIASKPTPTPNPLAGNTVPASPPPPERCEPSFVLPFLPTPEMLFRFSALTFNTHRIHWDRSYAVGIEGREDLVVHGPLTSLLLLNTLRQVLPQLPPAPSPSPSSSSITASATRSPHIASFSYRATSPLAVGRPIRFCGLWAEEQENDQEDVMGRSRKCELWVEDAEGKVYMRAQAMVDY